MTEEKRKPKNWALPEGLVVKFEMAFKEQDKYKFEQDFAAYLLGIGLDGRRKGSKKLEGYVERMLGEDAPCDDCGRTIHHTTSALVMDGKPPICLSCRDQYELEAMNIPGARKLFEAIRKLKLIYKEQIKENNRLADLNNQLKDRYTNLPALEKMLKEILEKDAELAAQQQEALKIVAEANRQVEKFLAVKTNCTLNLKETIERYLGVFVKEGLKAPDGEQKTLEDVVKALEEVKRASEKEGLTVFSEATKTLLDEATKASQQRQRTKQLEQEISEEIRKGLLIQMPIKTPSGRRKLQVTVGGNPVRVESEDTLKYIDDPDAAEKARDPTIEDDGRTYCHDGGLRVFPEKCEDCKKKSFAKWDECQKQKQREKQQPEQQKREQERG